MVLFLPIITIANTVNGQFVPFLTVSTIGEDNISRYTLQYTAWEDGGLNYNPNNTYEHETIFYNYDDSAYATAPYQNSWGATFPDAYLDTQALDGDNEHNITIGTFDPDELSLNQWQISWARLNETSSSESMYKINGQKGLSYCEIGPWCVLQSLNTAILIPFKSEFTAPASLQYSVYEDDLNTDGSHYARNTNIDWWNSGTMNSVTDLDYFLLDIPKTQSINFILKQSHFNDGEDYDIVIFDLGGNVVAYSNNGQGVDEVFSKNDMLAGKYFVKIYAYSGFNQSKTYNFIAYSN